MDVVPFAAEIGVFGDAADDDEVAVVTAELSRTALATNADFLPVCDVRWDLDSNGLTFLPPSTVVDEVELDFGAVDGLVEIQIDDAFDVLAFDRSARLGRGPPRSTAATTEDLLEDAGAFLPASSAEGAEEVFEVVVLDLGAFAPCVVLVTRLR